MTCKLRFLRESSKVGSRKKVVSSIKILRDTKMKNYQGFKDLIVYQKSFELLMEIFEVTKSFPKEEKYALTDQIRRSSRSIGSNLAEAWPKRKYVKSFVAKLIDSQSEACETIHWLDVSFKSGYIADNDHKRMTELTLEIQRMLQSMINNPEKFCY
jgi:four helix bundle protein